MRCTIHASFHTLLNSISLQIATKSSTIFTRFFSSHDSALILQFIPQKQFHLNSIFTQSQRRSSILLPNSIFTQFCVDSLSYDMAGDLITNFDQVSIPEVACVPACPGELRPVVGKKFRTLDEGIAFYEAYGRATGFDVRKRGTKAKREVVTLQYLVCNREGVKVGIEMNQMHACEGFITKRRRTSKRCDCKARMSLKYVVEGGLVGYVVHEFGEVHNHSMIELPFRRYMHINRRLGEVHRRLIWDCTKAYIGPTMTFKFLNEFLGGYDTVGITVEELRNYVHGLKTYVEGSDAQMLLDEMRRKKKACAGFTYHYELGSSNELKSLFWCDAVSKRNYQLYGDVVAFDSTYNTNRYCRVHLYSIYFTFNIAV